MRASSLSNAKVIDLLNHYYIPVHVDGVYYGSNDKVPAAEKAAYQQVFQAFHRLNEERQKAGQPVLSTGTVHAYVLTADGKPFDSLHVAEAKPERVIAMLKRAVQELNVAEGKPAVKRAPQAAAPDAQPDSLVLHLTARYLFAKGQPEARKDIDDAYVPAAPVLGTARSGQWTALPSEDWIELKREEWLKLLPAGAVEAGRSWDLDKRVAAQLLTRFYPTTENNDLATNRIDQQSLTATVLSVKEGVVQARIDGSLKMKHAFYPGREDQNFVKATIVGYMDFEPATRRIGTLRLVTDNATYGSEARRFGVAVRSVASPAK
ncbi:MAG TPA: hypothetical protein VKI17_04120 [Gemmataceae bacterium]|nr:hypothetical protein [Gemmataceae bacterium]